MELIRIENTSEKGEVLTALYCPSRGMNLVSFKKNGTEAIDQTTQDLFQERFAGFGALIGPHFYHRKDEEIPLDFDTEKFPFIKAQREKGSLEPFSHGIARYSNWHFEHSDTQIKGWIKGSDLLQGIPLKKLQGMDFEMTYEATMMPFGLFIRYMINSERPSVIGLHYYYALSGKGSVHADVQNQYNEKGCWNSVPQDWLKAPGKLEFALDSPADFGFMPAKHDGEYKILLKTSSHDLHIFYDTTLTGSSWQLWHPEKSSFVCIEPLTSPDPRKPISTHSLLEVKIEIF